jgi:UDP-glucose 4-epimerase
MCRAITWGMIRKKNNGGQYLIVNVGKNSSNYQVKQIANAVAKLIPKTKVSINKIAPSDNRSYLVDFTKYEKLAPKFQPIISLGQSIVRLKKGLLKMNFINKNFRESSFIRLNTLRQHIKNNRVEKNLRWKFF